MEELETLVIRAQAGDIEAYCTLVKRFQDMTYGYSFSLLGDFHLAQDAAQEAFVEAYRNLAQLRKPAAFPGWFRKAVFKHCDRFVRGKRLSTVPIEDASEIADFLEVPEKTVKSRLHCTRKRLKERMIEMVEKTIKGSPLPEDFTEIVAK